VITALMAMCKVPEAVGSRRQYWTGVSISVLSATSQPASGIMYDRTSTPSQGTNGYLGYLDAERFVFAWGFYERGRLGGLGQAIEMVEKLLCRGGVTAEQREVLLGLYDSLLETKTR
jgi:hypothetical protein